MGIVTLVGTRTYEAEALLVVARPIASACARRGSIPGTEIRVSGFAEQTYLVLATRDELVAIRRDSILACARSRGALP